MNPLSGWLLGSCLAYCSTLQAQTTVAPRAPLLIAPTVEGLLVCDAATQDSRITAMAQALAHCRQRREVGSVALGRLLDTLEPGGARGQVQVGYTLTVQLLGLYQKTPQGWKIDTAQVDAFLRLITQVRRPVVLYLAANHFDSQGPIVSELAQDPRNLMQLRDGKALELGYFGYKVVPWTLLADASIPVNHYRLAALRYIAQRVQALPKVAQERIAAITLAGELHQMFPDFENGMGRYQDIQVTDYSPASVAGFRQWLAATYGSIAQFNVRTGLNYPAFDAVPAPSKDIRKEKLAGFGEHYDAFADGFLPLAGWLWDPQNRIEHLELYVDGQHRGLVERGLNRLDVYRAEASVLTPNVGYRYDLDYSGLAPGKHRAQIVAQAQNQRYALAEVEFVIVPRDQSPVPSRPAAALPGLKDAKLLTGVRSWLDTPRPQQDLYFNPLARDWNRYRSQQVADFLATFHRTAREAGLPANKLYSHQIVPRANASWNHTLFATDATIAAGTAWKQGLNMYGGTTDSAWQRSYLTAQKIQDYGVPEFHPQQWKTPGSHLAALQTHYQAGARFISPYYFSIVPSKFKGAAEHGVNRMELSAKNTNDGSDQLYQAIRTFARQ